MVKFKRSKNRASAPAEGIVVGSGSAPAPQRVESRSETVLMKGSEISEKGGPVKNPTLVKPQRARKILISAFAGIVIVVLVVVGIRVFSSTMKNAKVETAKNALYDNSKKPDYNQISQNADGILGQAKTPKEKAKTYGRLASIAASAGDTKKAIQYYEEAAKLDELAGQMDAYALAQLYEADDNAVKAIEKYRIALKYFSELKFESSDEYDYAAENAVYINEIKAKLEQLQ